MSFFVMMFIQKLKVVHYTVRSTCTLRSVFIVNLSKLSCSGQIQSTLMVLGPVYSLLQPQDPGHAREHRDQGSYSSIFSFHVPTGIYLLTLHFRSSANLRLFIIIHQDLYGTRTFL